MILHINCDFLLHVCFLSGFLPPSLVPFLPRSSVSLQELASSLKISFLETSAKSADNVERAFLTMASEIHKRLASEGGGMQGESKEARAQSAKINSAPLWLGGEKQTQEASNCCWAGDNNLTTMICTLYKTEGCHFKHTHLSSFNTMWLCVLKTHCQNFDIFAIEQKTNKMGLFRRKDSVFSLRTIYFLSLVFLNYINGISALLKSRDKQDRSQKDLQLS